MWRSFAQFEVRAATNEMRSPRALYVAIGHSVVSSKNASPLKLTARDKILPSTSGRATFIAISRADRPLSPLSQSFSVLAENTTWKTGALQAEGKVSGLSGLLSPWGLPTAKEVQFRITVGAADRNS